MPINNLDSRSPFDFRSLLGTAIGDLLLGFDPIGSNISLGIQFLNVNGSQFPTAAVTTMDNIQLNPNQFEVHGLAKAEEKILEVRTGLGA